MFLQTFRSMLGIDSTMSLLTMGCELPGTQFVLLDIKLRPQMLGNPRVTEYTWSRCSLRLKSTWLSTIEFISKVGTSAYAHLLFHQTVLEAAVSRANGTGLWGDICRSLGTG